MRSKSGSCMYEDQAAGQGSSSHALPSTTPASLSHRQGKKTNETSSSVAESASSAFHATVSTVASTAPSTPPHTAASEDSELIKLKLRIRQLEYQISHPSQNEMSPISRPTIETTTSQLGGTLHVHCERTADSQHQPIVRGLSHKTRLLGQSHWAVNGVIMVRMQRAAFTNASVVVNHVVDFRYCSSHRRPRPARRDSQGMVRR